MLDSAIELTMTGMGMQYKRSSVGSFRENGLLKLFDAVNTAVGRRSCYFETNTERMFVALRLLGQNAVY